jgi:hypothetical protein
MPAGRDPAPCGFDPPGRAGVALGIVGTCMVISAAAMDPFRLVDLTNDDRDEAARWRGRRGVEALIDRAGRSAAGSSSRSMIASNCAPSASRRLPGR